jgi:hypothetical protein
MVNLKSTAPPPPTVRNNVVKKTVEFLQTVVAAGGLTIDIPTEVPCWFTYLKLQKDQKSVTADDIFLTFGNSHNSQEEPDTRNNILSSRVAKNLSMALLDLGRLGIPTPELNKDASITTSGAFIIIQVTFYAFKTHGS